MHERNIRCVLCGRESSFMVIGSTSTFGPPDLATRPAPLQRSTIRGWVQRCPECGYCAPSLDVIRPGSTETVGNADYQRQLNDQAFYSSLITRDDRYIKEIISQEPGYGICCYVLIHLFILHQFTFLLDRLK